MKVDSWQFGETIASITDEAPGNLCAPSTERLFRSAPSSSAAIVSGRGHCGTPGLRMLNSGRCFSIAKVEVIRAVSGSPPKVILAGVAESTESLDLSYFATLRALRGAAA